MPNFKKTSNKQERRVASELGGSTQANSGATRLGGGSDVRVARDTRCECKFTSKVSYTLKQADLKKIKVEALRGGLEDPVLHFAFRDRLGRMLERYAVTPCLRSEARHPWTAEKSITLGQQALLQATTLAPSVFVCFKDGECYEISQWDKYLDNREARCSKSTPSSTS
jgi:hypothetical protein